MYGDYGFEGDVVRSRMVGCERDVVWEVVVLGCDSDGEGRVFEESVDCRSNITASWDSEGAILPSVSCVGAWAVVGILWLLTGGQKSSCKSTTTSAALLLSVAM